MLAMRAPIVRRVAVTLGVLAIAAVATSASRPPAPPVKGVTYRLRMTSRLPAIMAQMQNGNGAGPAFLAKVKAAGKKARFEFQAIPDGTNLSLEDYVLIHDTAATFVNVAKKEYAEAPAIFSGGGGGLGMLSSIAGRSRRASDSAGRTVPQIEINGIDMDLQQLDGEVLDGRQVRRYQLVAEMNVMVMNTTAPLRIEMEMWTADLPPGIVNPFDITGTVSPDDPAAKLTSRLLAERKKIQGTPVKTVMTFIISGLANGAVPELEFGQTTQITDIKEVEIESKELELPAGYTRRTIGSGGRGGSGGR